MLAAGDVDYIDPGAAYYQFTYMVDSATQRQLESWRRTTSSRPTPDLAEGADDLRRWTDDHVHAASDIKFSPPVNREVKCDDFKYAIERALLPGVANGYVGAYLADIQGLRRGPEGGRGSPTKAPDISGITCAR